MAIGCGAKCAKLILVIFNFFFWLSGAAILGVGIWLLVDPTIVQFVKVIRLTADDPYLATASYILIGIGAFIFVVGFFGCCGAIKESKCMLGLYLFFLIIVMAGELAAGILVAVFKGQIESKLKDGMRKQIRETYGTGTNPDFTEVWDFLQYDRKCCGAVDAKDWKDSAWKGNQTKGTEKFVPTSCCLMKKDSTSDNMQPDDETACQKQAEEFMNGAEPEPTGKTYFHKTGCYNAITSWFSTYSTILIGVACGIAALEIFGFVFAVCLCRNLGDVDD